MSGAGTTAGRAGARRRRRPASGALPRVRNRLRDRRARPPGRAPRHARGARPAVDDLLDLPDGEPRRRCQLARDRRPRIRLRLGSRATELGLERVRRRLLRRGRRRRRRRRWRRRLVGRVYGLMVWNDASRAGPCGGLTRRRNRSTARYIVGSRSLFLVAAAAAAACLAATAAGSGGKPSIGKPVASPAQALAGSTFKVAFHVAHATSATFPTASAVRPSATPTRSGAASQRTSLTLTPSEAGKALVVKLTARSGVATVTKRVTFVVHAPIPPALSIGDASAPRGTRARRLSPSR